MQVTNEEIQRKLLAVKDLDLDKAKEIASALEVASKNARDIQKAQHSSHTTALAVGVNQMMNKDKGKSTPRPNGIPQPKFGNKGQKVKCYRCGGIHRQEDCRYRNQRCFSCRKMGHVSQMCRTKALKPVRDNRTHLVNDTQQPSNMTDDGDRRSHPNNGAGYRGSLLPYQRGDLQRVMGKTTTSPETEPVETSYVHWRATESTWGK